MEKQKDFVARVVKEEEESFLRTIDTGIKRFNIYTQATGGAGRSTFVMENIDDSEEDWKVTSSYISLIR